MTASAAGKRSTKTSRSRRSRRRSWTPLGPPPRGGRRPPLCPLRTSLVEEVGRRGQGRGGWGTGPGVGVVTTGTRGEPTAGCRPRLRVRGRGGGEACEPPLGQGRQTPFLRRDHSWPGVRWGRVGRAGWWHRFGWTLVSGVGLRPGALRRSVDGRDDGGRGRTPKRSGRRTRKISSGIPFSPLCTSPPVSFRPAVFGSSHL